MATDSNNERTSMSSSFNSTLSNSPAAPEPVPNAVKAGVAIGFFCIVAGGLVSAVTGPLDLAKGSWAAAYLVLVAGLVQYVISMQERFLHAPARNNSSLWARTLLWTGGNIMVLAGALLQFQALVLIGGLALIAVLVMALLHTKGAARAGLAWCTRIIYLVVILSVPVGLFLAQR